MNGVADTRMRWHRGAALPVRRFQAAAKALASTEKRNPTLPNVPTLNESGVPGYDAASWYGVFAPAGVSKSVLGTFSNEFGRFVQTEMAKWAKTIRAANIRAQ